MAQNHDQSNHGADQAPPGERTGTSPRYTRLNVNLNDESAEALRKVAESKGVSVTEAVRRAIALMKFIEDETNKDHKVQIVDKAGSKRELILM